MTACAAIEARFLFGLVLALTITCSTAQTISGSPSQTGGTRTAGSIPSGVAGQISVPASQGAAATIMPPKDNGAAPIKPVAPAPPSKGLSPQVIVNPSEGTASPKSRGTDFKLNPNLLGGDTKDLLNLYGSGAGLNSPGLRGTKPDGDVGKLLEQLSSFGYRPELVPPWLGGSGSPKYGSGNDWAMASGPGPGMLPPFEPSVQSELKALKQSVAGLQDTVNTLSKAVILLQKIIAEQEPATKPK